MGLTLKLDMVMTSTIPTSSISMTSPAKHRTQTRPWGLFFVCVPTKNREASFLDAQKARDDESSKGRMTLDLEKEMAWGFLSWFYRQLGTSAGKSWRWQEGGETNELREGNLDLLGDGATAHEHGRLGTLLDRHCAQAGGVSS